jgi:EAL domain-containing protein (putative c-di-GMP-specific phosphodiesterase class I)
MYRAKERGRGRAELFDDELREQVMHRLRIEADLRDAVADGELRLHYQPVVDLGSGRTVAVEALLRWQRADGELVPPGLFIPIAEDRGLIEEIGAWAIREACHQLARWDAEGTRVDVAVNVAPRQLLGGKLPDVVLAACTEAGIEPSRMTLELTERALLRDVDTAVAAVVELAALGVRLSIDDFGTGWSSLAYLKRLPVAELKIDRSFVAGVASASADRAIVEATIRLGQTLGLQTVAEGIETAEQMAALTALGCDRGQGYLLCRPQPPAGLLLAGSLVPVN